MKVSHSHDTATHAFIGNSEVQEMGIADSSALMQILSAALYSNPKAAVVREVICNAWDAHIASDNEDQPIHVNITESNKLIIKDFGNGIPHDKMRAIYGTYGASTKTNNSNETGGFGLGCKSPFAYTDTFQVVNSNGGIKGRYAMMRASDGVNGKPSMRLVTQVETEESGLTVEIQLQEEDIEDFETYIKAVCSEGGIPVEGNVCTLGPNDYLNAFKAELPFVLTTELDGIHVRYGNVIYPVEPKGDYRLAYDGIRTFVGRNLYRQLSLGGIVLMAPGNSISLTPSREHLTYTDRTVQTLSGLLQETLDIISNIRLNHLGEAKQNYNVRVKKYMSELSDDYFHKVNITGLVSRQEVGIAKTYFLANMPRIIPEEDMKWYGYTERDLHKIALYLNTLEYQDSKEFNGIFTNYLKKEMIRRKSGNTRYIRKLFGYIKGSNETYRKRITNLRGLQAKLAIEILEPVYKNISSLMEKYEGDLVIYIREGYYEEHRIKSLSQMMRAYLRGHYAEEDTLCKSLLKTSRLLVQGSTSNGSLTRKYTARSYKYRATIKLNSERSGEILKDLEELGFKDIHSATFHEDVEAREELAKQRKERAKELREKDRELRGTETKTRLKKGSFYSLPPDTLLKNVRKAMLDGTNTIENPKYYLVVNNSRASSGLGDYMTYWKPSDKISDLPFYKEVAFVTKAQFEAGKAKDLIELPEYIRNILKSGLESETGVTFNLFQQTRLIQKIKARIQKNAEVFSRTELFADEENIYKKLQEILPENLKDLGEFGSHSLRFGILTSSNYWAYNSISEIFGNDPEAISEFARQVKHGPLAPSFAVFEEGFFNHYLPELIKVRIGELSGYTPELDEVIRLLIKTVNKESV